MHLQRISLLVIPLLLVARPVEAETADARIRAARTACLTGDYARGAALLAELFLDTRDPNHIYNQGRCFEQNLRLQEAIGRFQEYLRVGKNLSETEKADAQRHITECQDQLARQVGQSSVAPDGPRAPVPQGTTALPAPLETARLPAAGRSISGLRIAGVVGAAVGAAGVITGIAFNLRFNSLNSDMQKNVDGYTAGRASELDTYRALGWAGYSVGAACLATGALLYYLGSRDGNPAASAVAVVPTLGPGQAGAVLKGGF